MDFEDTPLFTRSSSKAMGMGGCDCCGGTGMMPMGAGSRLGALKAAHKRLLKSRGSKTMKGNPCRRPKTLKGKKSCRIRRGARVRKLEAEIKRLTESKSKSSKKRSSRAKSSKKSKKSKSSKKCKAIEGKYKWQNFLCAWMKKEGRKLSKLSQQTKMKKAAIAWRAYKKKHGL